MSSEPAKETEVKSDPKSLINEVTEMKDRIARMDSFIKQAAALAGMEIRRVEEIKNGFEATLAALDAQLKEKDETLAKKDASVKDAESGLGGKIRDLESQLKQKEELLQARDAELKNAGLKNEQAAAQLKEKEAVLQQKESELKDLETNLTAEMRELEGRVKKLLEKQ